MYASRGSTAAERAVARRGERSRTTGARSRTARVSTSARRSSKARRWPNTAPASLPSAHPELVDQHAEERVEVVVARAAAGDRGVVEGHGREPHGAVRELAVQLLPQA